MSGRVKLATARESIYQSSELMKFSRRNVHALHELKRSFVQSISQSHKYAQINKVVQDDWDIFCLFVNQTQNSLKFEIAA